MNKKDLEKYILGLLISENKSLKEQNKKMSLDISKFKELDTEETKQDIEAPEEFERDENDVFASFLDYIDGGDE